MTRSVRYWLVCYLSLALLLLPGCATRQSRISNVSASPIDASVSEKVQPESITPERPFNEHSTFDDYLNYAFVHNPGLNAARLNWEMKLAAVPQARTLENPKLSANYFIEQYDARYGVSLQQTFPPFGTLSLREKEALAEAQRAYHDYEYNRFMVYDRMAQAVYNYYYLGRTIEILSEELRLLSDQERIAQKSYSTGKSSYSYLLHLQIEQSRITNELAIKKDERKAQSAVLSALLNLPAEPVFPWPNIEPAAEAFMDYALFELLLADLNPELKAAEARIDAAGYRDLLAQKNFLPRFTLGVGAVVMSGETGDENNLDINLMAGISLPIWQGAYRARARETAAALQAADFEKVELQNKLKAELRAAVVEAEDAGRRMQLYQSDLIPRAEQAVAVTRQDFTSGKADFKQLIDAQRTLLQFKLAYERALADREIAMAEIGCCIGKFTNDITNQTDIDGEL